MDRDCVQTCYQKCLFAMNHVNQQVVLQGRAAKSDFVTQAAGEKDKDRFVEEIFPLGGHTQQQSEDSIPWRKKFFESYIYSDPAKSGR